MSASPFSGSLPQRQKELHARLTRFNISRVSPGFIHQDWYAELETEYQMRMEEGNFVESERALIRHLARQAPQQADAFVAWFETLRDEGPGQGDPLFPWLANEADEAQMRWFLTQEAAGEAGFDDLVAMSQVKIPPRAKLEMARNYWDEMGRGNLRGMHGLMLADVVSELQLKPTIDDTVWESLALANLMVALAANRRYAWQAIGALGVIEMTAPTRVSFVNEGMIRLRMPKKARLYFQLHAGLDIEHSRAWNREVIHTLVAEDPRVAQPIAEGALMRLAAGARCFQRYREHLGLAAAPAVPAHGNGADVFIEALRALAGHPPLADVNPRDEGQLHPR